MCRPENDCLFKWCLRASWQGWLVLRLARSLGLLVGLGAFKVSQTFFLHAKKDKPWQEIRASLQHL